MTFNFFNKKTETDEQRIIRYADAISIYSNHNGELEKDCLDVIGVFTKSELPPPLDKIRAELRRIQPNYFDALGTVELDISTHFVQKNYDDVKEHLLKYGYIDKPNPATQEWVLNTDGKKMKQLKGHKKYQEYVEKKIKAEIAEMNGKIHWLRRAIIAGIIGFIVGLSTNYLKAKQVKQTDTQKELPKEQQVSPPSTPAKQLEKNDSLVNN